MLVKLRLYQLTNLKKQFPNLDDEDLETIKEQPHSRRNSYNRTQNSDDYIDKNQIEVLYFNYKTYMNEVYKVKQTVNWR